MLRLLSHPYRTDPPDPLPRLSLRQQHLLRLLRNLQASTSQVPAACFVYCPGLGFSLDRHPNFRRIAEIGRTLEESVVPTSLARTPTAVGTKQADQTRSIGTALDARQRDLLLALVLALLVRVGTLADLIRLTQPFPVSEAEKRTRQSHSSPASLRHPQ